MNLYLYQVLTSLVTTVAEGILYVAYFFVEIILSLRSYVTVKKDMGFHLLVFGSNLSFGKGVSCLNSCNTTCVETSKDDLYRFQLFVVALNCRNFEICCV